jgi:hypothetical protein
MDNSGPKNLCEFSVLGQPLNLTFTKADKCQIAIDNCEPGGIINFFTLYYCTLNESLAIYTPISVRGNRC